MIPKGDCTFILKKLLIKHRRRQRTGWILCTAYPNFSPCQPTGKSVRESQNITAKGGKFMSLVLCMWRWRWKKYGMAKEGTQKVWTALFNPEVQMWKLQLAVTRTKKLGQDEKTRHYFSACLFSQVTSLKTISRYRYTIRFSGVISYWSRSNH
jgi:hypothetical protein